MSVKLLQVLIILGVCVVEDPVEGAHLVNNILPAALDYCHVFLVIPTGFS